MADQKDAALQPIDKERERQINDDSGVDVRWEFQAMLFAGADPIAAMNKMGDKGWEPIQMLGQTEKGPLWLCKRRKRLVQVASSMPTLHRGT